MTDKIRILTPYEIERLKNGANVPVYGTFEKVIEAEIGLGDGNKDDLRTIQTINHETVHETLTEIFDRGTSFRFDRDLYYNFETCKKSEFFSKIPIRDAILAIFEDLI